MKEHQLCYTKRRPLGPIFFGQTPHVSCKVPLLTLRGCKVPVDSSLLLCVFFVFFPITVCIVRSENIAVCIVRAISSHGSSSVPSDPTHNIQYTSKYVYTSICTHLNTSGNIRHQLSIVILTTRVELLTCCDPNQLSTCPLLSRRGRTLQALH